MGFEATNNTNVRQNIALKIKILMLQRKLGDDDVANGINMELSTFEQKMKGLSDWKLSESKKLCNYFNVELSYIF